MDTAIGIQALEHLLREVGHFTKNEKERSIVFKEGFKDSYFSYRLNEAVEAENTTEETDSSGEAGSYGQEKRESVAN